MAQIPDEVLNRAVEAVEGGGTASRAEIDYDAGAATPFRVNPDEADYSGTKLDEGRHRLRVVKAALIREPEKTDRVAMKLLAVGGPQAGVMKDQTWDLGVNWQLGAFLNCAAACSLFDKLTSRQLWNTMQDFVGCEFFATVKHSVKLKYDNDGNKREVTYANFATDGYFPVEPGRATQADPATSPPAQQLPASPPATAPLAQDPAVVAAASAEAGSPPTASVSTPPWTTA